MSSAHSPTFPPLHLRHNSYSNPSVALPTSHLILQPLRCFTYVTVHSPTLFRFFYVRSSSLNSPGDPPMTFTELRLWGFSTPRRLLLVDLWWSSEDRGSIVNYSNLWAQLILQPFRHFTYVTTHYPTLPSLYLRHSSFSNLSVASPKSQLILQPFRRFTYVTAHSPTLPLLHLRHSSFSNHFFHFSYVRSSSLNSPGEPPLTFTELRLWGFSTPRKLLLVDLWWSAEDRDSTVNDSNL